MKRDEIVICRTHAFLRALGGGFHPRAHLRRPLLNLLCSVPGKIFTSREILEAVYGDDPNGGPMSGMRSVAVIICSLRKKGVLIVTHGRSGYSLAA